MTALPRLMAALLIALVAALPVRAQTLIRDADIERALAEIAAPVISAAGLSSSSIRTLVIQDRKLNAFVVDHKSIFIHSGLILKLKSVEELQAVIAHELAHIANGHISRRISNYRSSRTLAGLGLALGAAAAVASGSGEAGVGLAMGVSSAAQRSFLSHTRAEESSADRAAVSYMVRAGIDPQAMVDVMEIFRGQEALNVNRQDPYVLTHPLSRERVRALKGLAAGFKGRATPPSASDAYWYARMRAKLGGWLQNPSYTLRRVKSSDKSEIALLTRAVAYHRMPKTKDALANMNALVAKKPNDPYYQELRGQILLESRQFNAAVSAYKRAVALAPKHALIQAGYGRALLAAGRTKEALRTLKAARARDFRNPSMLRDLAQAYAQTGNPGMASVATAERYALLGRLKDAEIHAKRAEGLLPRGSSGWLRAQDILVAAKRVKKK